MVSYWFKWFNQEQLVLRMAGSAVLSFLIVIIFTPRLIRMLVRKKIGDRAEFDHKSLNEIMRHKSNTPTMGGLLISLAILVATLVFANVLEFYVRMALVALVWLAGLGGADDYFKIRKFTGSGTRDGLRMWEKILFQIGLAVLLGRFIFYHGAESTYENLAGQQVNAMAYFCLPFKADPIFLDYLGFVIVTVVTMMGSSNAVNLTDGMDGLAGGCMMIVSGVFLILSLVAGKELWSGNVRVPYVPQAAELGVICAAMIGACAGFLWYNCHPARIFMGDTGSLTLGGLIGYIAVVTRQEMILFIAGGVFVMEAVSVILQVGYFKATHGKRLFRCAPIHHHFHLAGWAEPKVVVRFWLLTGLLAAVALATLKLR